MKIYNYKGIKECPSTCGLEIYRKDQTVYVIVTELEANTGTSVTNWSAELATEICQRRNISPQKLVFIEHYLSLDDIPEHYDQVIFEFNWYARRFFGPVWRRVDNEQVKKWVEGSIIEVM